MIDVADALRSFRDGIAVVARATPQCETKKKTNAVKPRGFSLRIKKVAAEPTVADG